VLAEQENVGITQGRDKEAAMRFTRRMPIAVGLMLIASGAPLLGQTRTVRGVVVDSASGKALAGASTYANRTPGSERTGKDGRFALTAEPLESFFVVRVPGYVPARVAWAGADSSGDVGTVRLRKVKEDADRFAVQTEDLRVYPQLAPFYERKAGSRQGAFLTPDDVERNGTAQLSMVIRRTAVLQSMCFVTRERTLDCGNRRDRGPTTIMNAPAQEQVCIASVWTYGGIARETIDEVRMDELIAVEGYPSAGATPREFSGNNCAVVVLWVKR
jgi:hypothetical protein